MLAFDVPPDKRSCGATDGAAGGDVDIHPETRTPMIMNRIITAIFMNGVVITREHNGCDLVSGMDKSNWLSFVSRQ